MLYIKSKFCIPTIRPSSCVEKLIQRSNRSSCINQ